MTNLNDLENATSSAFGVSIELDLMDIDCAFSRHHLVYAATGLIQLEANDASWRLPPSRAAWIPATTRVRAISWGRVRGISIFFARKFVVQQPFQCRVFNISPLAREMILYALRWGAERPSDDEIADRFFLTLAEICQELFSQPDVLYLPKAQSPELQSVLDYTVEHLNERLQFEALAQMANVSERTLARRFSSEIHMTWRQFLNRARMIRAMDLLAQGNNVTTTAFEVGFQNIGAFSTAFQNFTALTPTQYQKQAQA